MNSTPPQKNTSIYNATIKLFGSEPDPAFEDPARMERIWGRAWGCDSDVGRIRAVLMHRPGDEFGVIDRSKRINATGSYGDPETGWYWQSETIPSLAELQEQHDNLVTVLRGEDIEVIEIEGVGDGRFKSVYTRDSCIAIKGGAIVTRLAPRMRHGEELAVSRTLARAGMPILRTLHGTAMAEGGSFAWLNSRTAVIGRGIRNNNEGIAQIRDVLAHQGIDLIVIDLRGYDIHIDGHFLMVDSDLALVWAPGLPFTFLEKLKELGIDTVELTDHDNRWIVNGLAVRPRCLVMPEGISEETRVALDRKGVKIMTVPYDKMQLNGGGIHCSTSPLIRDRVD